MSHYYAKRLRLRLTIHLHLQWRSWNGEWAFGLHLRGVGLEINLGPLGLGVSAWRHNLVVTLFQLGYYPPNRGVMLWLGPWGWEGYFGKS